MSIVLAIDIGNAGVVLGYDAACYSGSNRCEDMHKIIVKERFAIGITGYKRNYALIAQMLKSPKMVALLLKDFNPFPFGEEVAKQIHLRGAPEGEYPPNYHSECIIVYRDAPRDKRLWATQTDLVFHAVQTGPGCDPYPMAAIGSGSYYAMGAWVGATPGARRRVRGAATRAIQAACTLCAYCAPPITIRHLWPKGI